MRRNDNEVKSMAQKQFLVYKSEKEGSVAVACEEVIENTDGTVTAKGVTSWSHAAYRTPFFSRTARLELDDKNRMEKHDMILEKKHMNAIHLVFRGCCFFVGLDKSPMII